MQSRQSDPPQFDSSATVSVWTVFLIFLRLGLTSFGGPVAHLGFFRNELIVRRRWLSEQAYADLLALCHFLPGPTSSQVGMGLGMSQAGLRGAFAAWLGFTMPSAIILMVAAITIGSHRELIPEGLLQGLAVVVVAVIAQAVWGMMRSLCPDAPRASLMIAVCCYLLLFPSAWGQVIAIGAAALIGILFFKDKAQQQENPITMSVKPTIAIVCLACFIVLLVTLPLLAQIFPTQALLISDAFYRAGSFVFGGGHVVLPLLQTATVDTAWVTQDTFLAGYGLTQAMPGPLFTFAAFLGASMDGAYGSIVTGMLALVAIFLPSFLLIVGVLPFWDSLRQRRHIRSALLGVNAAVVGLLVAALYSHAWVPAIRSNQDFALALVALTALTAWKMPPWLVVLAGALIGWLWL